MKFSFKIAIFSFIIIVLSLGCGGFLIINSCFLNELEININGAKENNKYLSNVYYSIANNNLNKFIGNSTSILNEFEIINNNDGIFIGTDQDLKYYDKNSFFDNLKNNEQGNQIIDVNGNKYIQVITRLEIDKKNVYFENLVDISKIYSLRDSNYKIYCVFLIIVSIVCSIVTYLFSIHITKPLNKLKKASNIIANGNFNERISINGKDMKTEEFISLATDFNHMANKIENYIIKLEDYNKRQDEFISRFTHELKTPLTSIIGYADILRTYDTDFKKQHELSSYIYKEGKRLENLSHNLLELILLKKDKFDLKILNTKYIFNTLKNSLKPLLEKYKMSLELHIEYADVNIEPTLFASLIYNLIDNSCKASNVNGKIILSGTKKENRYIVSVEDFGKGIPKDSIDKVTTAFYMVDKSRARKQGGAGIGLSLCEEIAKIHNSSLKIVSVLGKGTKISFDVEVMK